MNKRSALIAAGLTILGALGGFAVKALADGIPSPNPLYYSGTLTEANAPVDGMRTIGINLYADGTSTSPICQTVASNTKVTSGRFRIQLADGCKAQVNTNSNAYVEVVDGTTSLGRSKIGAVPYAVEADHAINATSASNGSPPGTIVGYGGTSAPNGWLLCDGSSLLRTTYPALFGAIGTAWGAADATHFNLPDLRGRFVRGADDSSGRDPNATSRQASNPGGNTGSAVGTMQADAFASHDHGGATGNATRQNGGFTDFADYGGTGTAPSGPGIQYATESNAQGPLYAHVHPISAQGGSETRPINAAAEWLIKSN